MALYRHTYPSWNRENWRTDMLTTKYYVIGGWLALEGLHHTYHLYQDSSVHPELGLSEEDMGGTPYLDRIGPGVRNLRVILEHDIDLFRELMDGVTNPSGQGLDKPTRALWLAIDPACAPEATIKVLRRFLHEEHKAYKGRKGKLESEFLDIPWPHWQYAPYRDPKKKPLIQGYEGIKTWLNYFKCYDLRRCEGISFGQIAEQVYGSRTRQTYERAEKAVKRVRQLIHAAEHKKWPPSIR